MRSLVVVTSHGRIPQFSMWVSLNIILRENRGRRKRTSEVVPRALSCGSCNRGGGGKDSCIQKRKCSRPTPPCMYIKDGKDL
jgi:hypothetical protein